MLITIFEDRTISEVQQDFNEAYPFLKIEFFKNGTVRKDRYPAHLQYAHGLRLKEAWIKKKEEGFLDVSDTMTVSELENSFLDYFGLSVQVFRRSGNIWLETTITDSWTLKQQNDHGKEISTHYKKPIS